MIIALFPNEKKKQSFDIASQIKTFLEERSVRVVAEDNKAAKIGAAPLSSVKPHEISFMICMGGDGTLLRITHHFHHLNAPILGINLGHLGFIAAGGPILSPTLDAIVITPICPHTISNRPIVLTADRHIEIEYLSDYPPIDVRSDGLDTCTLSKKETLKIQRSSRIFKLVKFHRHEYFSTLRTKLGWSGSHPVQ
ncbi:MAG: NAD(+)/NADH kinase [Chlamydiia bacterium]|nr:NAD(+)/NADH kinase [Chlamydiia bacterium]